MPGKWGADLIKNFDFEPHSIALNSADTAFVITANYGILVGNLPTVMHEMQEMKTIECHFVDDYDLNDQVL